MIERIGEHINGAVVSGAIDYVHRVQSNQNVTKGRSTDIIVRLHSRKYGDRFLMAKRIKIGHLMKLLLKDEVFMNEHITPANKISFKEARHIVKTKKYKCVWDKNGIIFCRKTDSSKIFHIENHESLMEL